MVRKLYISDCHFGHKNVIKFDNRPFGTVEEMDAYIIKRWNEVVSNQDDVYILGDFSWYGPKETEKILKQLKGRKFLIEGNHDHWLNGTTKKLLINVKSYSEIKDNGRKVVLCHYPIPMCVRHNTGTIHLFGHVHNSHEEKVLAKMRRIAITDANSTGTMFNVGCMLDYMNYQPRELDHIIRNGLERWERLEIDAMLV